MKMYTVKSNPLIGEQPIIISRKEIDDIKKKIKLGEYQDYNLMLNLLSSPVAMLRVCLVPGTDTLRRILNSCIIIGRLNILIIISLLLFKLWFWAIFSVVITFILSKFQTNINYEIAARLFALDQHLHLRKGF